jgi:hypothetical protein
MKKIDVVKKPKLIDQKMKEIYLFVCLLRAARAIFQPSGGCDVTITGDRAANFGLCLALRTFEQGGIFIMPHLLRHGTSVSTVSSERPAHTSHSGIRTPRRKDHQIIAPEAVTTAPRRRLKEI